MNHGGNGESHEEMAHCVDCTDGSFAVHVQHSLRGRTDQSPAETCGSDTAGNGRSAVSAEDREKAVYGRKPDAVCCLRSDSDADVAGEVYGDGGERRRISLAV